MAEITRSVDVKSICGLDAMLSSRPDGPVPSVMMHLKKSQKNGEKWTPCDENNYTPSRIFGSCGNFLRFQACCEAGFHVRQVLYNGRALDFMIGIPYTLDTLDTLKVPS